MATPFADPRTGQLYFRRAVPEALRAAFDNKAQVKVTLGTKDPFMFEFRPAGSSMCRPK